MKERGGGGRDWWVAGGRAAAGAAAAPRSPASRRKQPPWTLGGEMRALAAAMDAQGAEMRAEAAAMRVRAAALLAELEGCPKSTQKSDDGEEESTTITHNPLRISAWVRHRDAAEEWFVAPDGVTTAWEAPPGVVVVDAHEVREAGAAEHSAVRVGGEGGWCVSHTCMHKPVGPPGLQSHGRCNKKMLNKKVR